jgi:Flp pilus assembly protein TadG
MARRLIRFMLRANRGQALAEFALLIPVMVIILLGAGELARLAYASIEITNAAHAGAEYGAQSYQLARPANYSNIEAAAALDAQNIPGFTATAQDVCTCENGTTVACDSALTTCGSSYIAYLQVNTSATYAPLFHCPGLPQTYTVTAKAIMRVQ